MLYALRNARHDHHAAPKAVSLTLGLCAIFASAFCVPAQAKVLAKVNGVEITDDDLKFALKDIMPAFRASSRARRAKLI